MKIIWSSRAKITFYYVLSYLEKNWTIKEIKQFSNKTEVIIHSISKNPHMFPASLKHQNIRKAVIDKNNSLFYKIDSENNKIYLLTFFDNRQDPGKLNL